MINAGDLLQLSCEHTELGPKVFEPKSGEDHNMLPGGFKSNDDDGNITSAGQRIDVLNRYPWSMEPTIGAVDGDVDFLQALADSPIEGQWTATFANGETRTGKGKPVGDIALNQNAGTIGFKIAGSLRFETI
jgi:hypothetical protein